MSARLTKLIFDVILNVYGSVRSTKQSVDLIYYPSNRKLLFTKQSKDVLIRIVTSKTLVTKQSVDVIWSNQKEWTALRLTKQSIDIAVSSTTVPSTGRILGPPVQVI